MYELFKKREDLQGQAIHSARGNGKRLCAVVWEEHIIGIARMHATVKKVCLSNYTFPNR